MTAGVDPTRRFSTRVEYYRRYRPSYPTGLIALLEEGIGLTRSDVVADIGSGTGKLGETFLRNVSPLKRELVKKRIRKRIKAGDWVEVTAK